MEAVAQTKNLQIYNNVVMMLPSSIRCIACRNVMAKGTMFNSRKEEAADEEFCPWKDRKFRFYFNYTQCSAEIVILIRTNQRYSGLVVEAGASNYYGHETPWLGLPCVIEKESLVPYQDPNWQEKRDKLFGASLFNMVPALELNGTLHKSTVSYTELLLNTVESGKQLGECDRHASFFRVSIDEVIFHTRLVFQNGCYTKQPMLFLDRDVRIRRF